MKFYKPLPIPKDTAWDRKTWRRYVPIWLKEFVDGTTNIIRWVPTLYRDRDWDDFYITKVLQKKIEMSGSGEPGFFFTNDANWGLNPCAEISLCSVNTR